MILCNILYEVDCQWAFPRICGQPEKSDHRNHMTGSSLGNQVTSRVAEVGGAEAVWPNQQRRILDSERSVGFGLRRFSSPQKESRQGPIGSYFPLHSPPFSSAQVCCWAAVGQDDASQTVKDRSARHSPPEAACLWSSALLDLVRGFGCFAPPLFSSEACSEYRHGDFVSLLGYLRPELDSNCIQ